MALTVLAIGGIAAVRSVQDSQDALISVSRMETATRLAGQKLFEIQKQGYDDISEGEGEFDGHPDFAWSVSTTPLFLDPLWKMTLTVRHIEGGKPIVVELLYPAGD